MYGRRSARDKRPRQASTRVTAGLKWAPEMPAKVTIRAARAAPVARVLASSASAPLPPARRSPMMPDPTTAAASSPVPTASPASRWLNTRTRLGADDAAVVLRDDDSPRARAADAGAVRPRGVGPGVQGVVLPAPGLAGVLHVDEE